MDTDEDTKKRNQLYCVRTCITDSNQEIPRKIDPKMEDWIFEISTVVDAVAIIPVSREGPQGQQSKTIDSVCLTPAKSEFLNFEYPMVGSAFILAQQQEQVQGDNYMS